MTWLRDAWQILAALALLVLVMYGAYRATRPPKE